jgi:hypothetical protein
MSRCNACGCERKLDCTHKAGKQLLKDIPTFYSANPEFRGKGNKVATDAANMASNLKAVKDKAQPSEKQTADEDK